jgi:hypothetical protein
MPRGNLNAGKKMNSRPARMNAFAIVGLLVLAIFVAISGFFLVALTQRSAPAPVASIAVDEPVACLTFSPDGQYLVGGCWTGPPPKWQGGLRVWDVRNRELVGSVKLPQRVQAVSLSPKGDLLAIACGCPENLGYRHDDFIGFKPGEGGIRILSFPALEEKATFQDGIAQDCIFSADGNWLAGSFSPYKRNQVGSVSLWSIPKMKLERQIEGSEWRVAVAFSGGEGAKLVHSGISSGPPVQRVFSLIDLDRDAKSQIVTSEPQYSRPIRSMQRYWKDPRLFVGFDGSPIQVIDLNTGESKPSGNLAKASRVTKSFAVSEDGQFFVCISHTPLPAPSAGTLQSVMIWDVPGDKMRASWVLDRNESAQAVAISRDASLLAVTVSRGREFELPVTEVQLHELKRR